MSIETSLSLITNIREQLKSQTKTNKNYLNDASQNFNDQLNNNLNQKTTSNDDNLKIFRNIQIHNIEYEKIYKELKEIEKSPTTKSLNVNDKFYNDIKIGLTPPYENFHNLTIEEQNKIKESTVDIFGAQKGTIHLITCTSVREFYNPIIKIALGEVMSYMSLEESIAFGNNLQNNINNAMKDFNLLTINEEGTVVLNFEEKEFINFINSIMKNNETNQNDKSLNNLYEKVLIETDRRFHPFETMQREEALRNKQFQQEKEENQKFSNEAIEVTKKLSVYEDFIKNLLNQRFSNSSYIKNYNSYDYLELIKKQNCNTLQK